MSDLGDAIGNVVGCGIAFIAAAAFGIGALAMWLIPKLWHWLVPIIHRATA